MDKFKSEICTLEKSINSRFVIPTYQRPFVWQDKQINKLIDDFVSAFQEGKGEKPYFIGTVLCSKNNGTEELIDGQQRFTSLLLIATAFKAENIDSLLLNFLKTKDRKLRLGFAIRTKLTQYIKLLVKDVEIANNKFTKADIKDDPFLINIARAISTIRSKLNNLPLNVDKKQFGNYIYKKIMFVKNTAPSKTDLNKLFATINNSGIQLEQTDILKSILLKYIKTDKFIYSRIWEACENMSNFFERNVRSLFPNTKWSELEKQSFKIFNKEIFINNSILSKTTEFEDKSFSITEILNANCVDDEVLDKLKPYYYAEQQDTDEVVYCNSIINFSQLLLHTYRIFLKSKGKPDFELPFHSKNLLQIFANLYNQNKETVEKNIKDFFEYLWKVRYVFDKYVIKWIEKPGEKEKTLLLTTVNKSEKNYFSRSNQERNNLSMLQSVLYFTSNYNTQIWLSTFLYYLQNDTIDNPEKLLETIDNELSLSNLQDKETTYILMQKLYIDNKMDFREYLSQKKGTSFMHYWFQKLEYILWKNWSKEDDRFKHYRIISKNSVEHIFPQHHEFGYQVDKKLLNDFGNLALLSVSQNSSYSNQDVKKKIVDFDYKDTYDSLKLASFFDRLRDTKWTEQIIIEHQKEMINKFIQHYDNE